MRLAAACALLCSTGCSFFLTKGPGAVEPGTDPAKVDCTTSGVIPAIDAIGGAGAIAASAGGTLLELAREDPGDLKNFKYYYALPLLAVGIAYMWSASYGTDNNEACNRLKDKEDQPALWQVQPIDPGKAPAKDDEKPPSIDDITP